MRNRIDQVVTKRGDQGMTALADGKNYSKHHARIRLVGELDEANCQLGVVAQILADNDSSHLPFVRSIQSRLFDIGSATATGLVSVSFEEELRAIEAETRRSNEQLEPLKEFVIPGGGTAATHTHLARAVVRRVERVFWEASLKPLEEAGIGKYLNRLSDYLFVLARTLSSQETLWEPMK